MVGYAPESKEQLTKIEIVGAGATSGVITRGLLQPLDVVKVRFQLQVEPLSRKNPDAKYWNVTQATNSILREEGAAALWKGHVPAQLLSVIYGGIQFLSFEFLTKQAWQLAPHTRDDETKRLLVHFVCGGASGCFATLFAYPFDTIRTRLIAQSEPKAYASVRHAFVTITAKEGPSALFKGLSPSLIQIAPHTGAQFAFYELITDFWRQWFSDADNGADANSVVAGSVPRKSNSVIGSLVCGSLAGMCSKTMIYPLDLAKKRLQMQGFEAARKGFGKAFTCQGLTQCLWFTLRHEGVSGLYKGLWPGMLKAAAATALHFTVYEQACGAIVKLHR